MLMVLGRRVAAVVVVVLLLVRVGVEGGGVAMAGGGLQFPCTQPGTFRCKECPAPCGIASRSVDAPAATANAAGGVNDTASPSSRAL